MKDSGIKVGQRYGKLEVIRQDGIWRDEKAWIVKCDCGKEERVRSYYLKTEKRACTKCSKTKDMTGKRFGKLTVIRPAGKIKNKSNVWICQCDCGNECEYPQGHLIAGFAKSCQKCGYSDEKKKEGTEKHNLKVCIGGSKYDQIKENRKPNRNNKTTGVLGVWYDKRKKKYIAELRFGKQRVFYKAFDDIEDAIEARKEAEKKYFEPIREEYHSRAKAEV